MVLPKQQKEFIKDIREYLDYLEDSGNVKNSNHSAVADDFAFDMYDKYFKHLPENLTMSVGQVLSEIRYLTLLVR